MKTVRLMAIILLFCGFHSLFAANKTFDRDMFFVPQNAPKGTWTLMQKAANLAAKSQHCVQVIGGAWSTKTEAAADGTPDKQFYVQCQSNQPGPIAGSPAAFNLYYSYADLHNGTVKQRPQPISDKVAITECRQAILERLPYPSSAKDMSLIRYGTNGTDNNLVLYHFTTLNAFGNRVPEKGSCIITPKNEVEVSITAR